MATPILEVRSVFQHFSLAGGKSIEILHDINLEIREQEVVEEARAIFPKTAAVLNGALP